MSGVLCQTRPQFNPIGRLVSKRRPPLCSMRRDRSRAWHALNAVPSPKPTRSKIDAQRRKALPQPWSSQPRTSADTASSSQGATRRAAGDGQRRGGAASLLDALSGTLVVETTRRAFGEARQEVDIYTRAVTGRSGWVASTPFCSGRTPVRNPEPPTSIATEPPRLANDSWAECGRNGWKRDEEVTALLRPTAGSS